MGLIILILILAILFAYVTKKLENSSRDFFFLASILFAFSLIATASLCVMIIVAAGSNLTANADKLKLQEQYNSLIYKVENEKYRDEFGLVNKEVIDEIQEWNENCTYYQALEKDFWIGVFYPNIFHEFEVINLDNIKY